MDRLLKVSLVGLLVAASACYHATVETGLAPSNQVIEKSFASAWINGLVPPSTIGTASKCPHGVAKVETQLSFVNLLVAAITFSIYTPMNIKVTCAEAGRGSLVPQAPTIDVGANATPEQWQDALTRAAEMSLQRGEPVYVSASRRTG